MRGTHAGPALGGNRDLVTGRLEGTTPAERRKWRDDVERALNERDAALRYEARQRELRRGRAAAQDRDRPFLQRLGRLIAPPR
jgi:hypothetical protein